MACRPPLPDLWSRCLRALLLGSSLLFGVLPGSSQAQITLDGSLGPPGPLTGPDYRIGAELGQLRGSNLFHSFGAFNVPTGGSATFTGPPTIANILSRVTGGQPSAIDGVLRSEIAGANLYLLNPSGVLFGPNARLDVSGSVHVSTADVLRFADGAQFFANLGQASVLTVAEPAAFGFLGPNPAAMTIQGSRLAVNEGKALSVVGGDIAILGNGGPLMGDSVPTLRAPGGRLQLASVASPGEVGFSRLELAPDLQVDSFARLGRIQLSQRAFLDASGNGGGTVLLRSGRLRVDGLWMFADNTGPIHGAGVGLDLRIGADAVLTNGALLTTDSLSAGRARDLRVVAGSLQLLDGSLIGARGFGFGNGPNIEVQVGTLTLTGGAQLSSGALGAGWGGDVTVAATEAITISGRDSEGNPSGLFSTTAGPMPGGNLQVAAPHIQLSDGGTITASSSGTGDAGTISLRAGETFRSQDGAVTTEATRAGRGTIELRAGQLLQLQDSEVTTSVRVGGRDAGNLTLDAPFVVLNGGQLTANAFGGFGGNLRIGAEVLLVDPASSVSASSTLEISGFRPPPSGTLASLTQTFVSVAALLPARCAARFNGGRASSLVLGGRDGLPLEPSGVLPSPLALEERLVADPAATGAPHRQKSAAKFALLAGHEKGLPRLGCPP